MSNVPCSVCTNVSRSAASNAQISCGSRKTRLRLRRATMRAGAARGAAPPRAALMQPPQALPDALLVERLEQVVDDAELERLERVLRRTPSRGRTSAPSGDPASERTSESPVSLARRARRAARRRTPTSMPDRRRVARRAPAAPRRRRRPRRRPRRARTTRAARPGSCAPATRPRRRAREAAMRVMGSLLARPRRRARRSTACPALDDSRRSDALRRLELEPPPHGLEPERAGADVARRASRARCPRRRTRASRRSVPRARTTTSPAPSPRRSAPCFTAFSTSGCRSRRGSSALPRTRARCPTRSAATPRWRASRISRVAPEPGDLLVERLQLARLLHGVAQEVAQAHEEPPRLARVLGDQAGDGVERVEQEVRLEVGAQARELGVAAELLRLERADARALDRERIHERERPEAEVELRVEHAEESPSARRLTPLGMCRRSSGTCMATTP